MTRPDGVYLGVALEQNFTFIAALKPKVAFIMDIRRGNLLGPLMYKALFETTDNRVDFAFQLFGRKRPQTVSTAVGVEELFTLIGNSAPNPAFAAQSLNDIKNRLTKTHGFPLSQEDLEYIDYVYLTFADAGPGVQYNMSGGYGGGGGFRGGSGFRGGRSRMPNYADLMTETDSLGTHRSYLASDEAFRVIKDMQERNAIIPFTGDFAGTKALRAFGSYVRDNGAVVPAIYVSNVEQYLFQSVDNWSRYYENVAKLPTDSTSVFIRSASQGYVRQQSINSRQNELLCPIAAHMKGFNADQIRQYLDVFQYCK